MIRSSHAFGVLLLAALAGCGEGEPEAGDAGTTAAADSAGGVAGMGGMDEMDGMAGMGGMDTAMVSQMRAHMRAMGGAGGDSLLAMRDQHRQMAANLLARMNQEMRDMGMAADSAWSATVDSLRSDLTRMPEMSASEMQTFMPEHHRRMERLMTSHEEMMRQMGH